MSAMETPAFWKTDLEYIGALAEKAKRADVREAGRSAGGRPVYQFSYGDRENRRGAANYSSACGAHDKTCYVRRGGKPVVMLLGAEHGAEVEGTAALVSLIHLLEEDNDLLGDKYESLRAMAGQVRLVIVPVCNPDGRARFPYASALGMTMEEQRYWFQGTWKDGSLCGWPGCKQVHPIGEAAGFLGAYFNDDGVNILHDNFFRPMAPETQIILDLADAEQPDIVIHLHGGSNSANHLLMTSYVPAEHLEATRELAVRCDAQARSQLGLMFRIDDVPDRESGSTPPSFNLASAVHHVCGCKSMIFESNQCVTDYPGAKYTHEQICRSHMILFEQALRMALEKAES